VKSPLLILLIVEDTNKDESAKCTIARALPARN
jgi:hypothetical protein